VAGTQIEAQYIQWLPEDEAEALRSSPVVKKSSLEQFVASLFDAAKSVEGVFHIEQFVSLLMEAHLQSKHENVRLSPLALSTPDELDEALRSKLSELHSDDKLAWEMRLKAEGWLTS
jgi:hypothetical protein